MRKILLATTALLALVAGTPASADVILDRHLSGTGDNVIFNSVSGDLATALLNGQHANVVQFRDLTGSTTFSASANGNDIKLTGSNNIFIQVFDPTDTFFVGTTTQVFSLKGTGDVTAFVRAVDAFGNEELLTFALGAISPTAQSGFTFNATNGEIMTSLRLLDLNGNINDFEHYRIDVAAIPVAVPGPIAGALGIPGLITACLGMLGLGRWRRNRLEA